MILIIASTRVHPLPPSAPPIAWPGHAIQTHSHAPWKWLATRRQTAGVFSDAVMPPINYGYGYLWIMNFMNFMNLMNLMDVPRS